MATWTAEVTNDPERDFDLYVEILCEDDYVARIQRGKDGTLELLVYQDKMVGIPLPWLMEIATRAIQDLGK